MMYSRIDGTSRTRSAAKLANWLRAVAVSGVTLLPYGITVATMRMSRNSPPAAIDFSACSWSRGTALSPGIQIAVILIVSKPAAFASWSFVMATCGSALRPSSSAAPMYMLALPSAAAGTVSAARAQRAAMKVRSCDKGRFACGPKQAQPV
jgi:hypothetical protein